MKAADSAARPPSPQQGLWTGRFLVLFSINAMAFGSLNLLLPTLPVHLAGRGYGEGAVGLLFGAFFFSCVASRLLAAWVGRRLGAATAARAGLAAAAAGNLLFLLPGGFPTHLAARLVYGAGFGVTSTLVISMAVGSMPPRRLAEGLGYLSLAATAALAVGPLIGVTIVRYWDFTALQLSVAGALALGLACTALLGSGPPPAGGEPAAAARGGPAGGASAAPARGGPAGGATAALPAAWLCFLLGAANAAFFSFLALHLDRLGTSGAARFFAVATFGIAATRIFGGRLFDRHGHFWIVVPSAGLIAAANALVFLAVGPLTIPLAGLIFGLGMGALFPALQALAIGAVPDSGKTAASAAALNGYDLGSFLNTVLLGYAAGLIGGFRPVFAVGAFCALLLLAVYRLHPAFRKGR